MASTIEQNVTIGRAYFETLLRRSHNNPEDINTSTVTITRSEYESLETTGARHENLRRNLLRGGVGEETLEISTRARPLRSTPKQNWKTDQSCPAASRSNTASPINVTGRPHHERQCAPSLVLSGLTKVTTHADITEAVRGGQLLDVFLKVHERSAAISFVQSADAQAFLDYVRRHDLYIKHKRVEVHWSDCHSILPNHVANKLRIGATRNLIIRRHDPRLTEAIIKEDMEHIHNLVVIKVEFLAGACYIKTNFVHNAMFARTCMNESSNGTRQGASANAMANRFDLLNIGEDDSDDPN
ncbi:hypothetical protein BD289DRAFT_457651 [Coniella lustricola]|uniref:RRM domain-containing protein n=1 Tax=Coniella lustricola TaxID=2025994 RepID=A0A2T3AN45_9PEZI|nr:hypothetical protein BD289DRAFT_457651 [Coniella lustricola]